MPKIDVFTARGRTGTIEAQASPDSFGAQTGEGLQRFGQALESVSDKLQQQRDELDVVDRGSYFDQKMAEKYQEILTSRDNALRGGSIQETAKLRVNALHKWARGHFDSLGTTTKRDVQGEDGADAVLEIPPASKLVRHAMEQHILKSIAGQSISMQADYMKAETERQGYDFQKILSMQADAAAANPSMESIELDKIQQEIGRKKDLHIFSVEFIEKTEAATYDRFWRQSAKLDPRRMLALNGAFLNGKGVPDKMDQSKMQEYSNIALAQIHAQDTAHQAAIKDEQDKNHATFVAQAIRGGMDRGNLATIVEQRGIDPDKATALVNLNDKIKEKQREEHFIDGRTPQIETRLQAMKFDPKTTPAKVEAYRQTIFDDRMKDQISQRDFEHLMSTWQGVNEHIHQEDKAGSNTAVTHAHEVLSKTLQVTGPMGFDSLGNQVQSSAILDFYREVERDPKANPMDIAEKITKRYKPIIEQRIKLGEKDQNQLDTAKMEELAGRGGISKAALQEWKDSQQQKQGQSIVDQTIADYVPPTEPGWFDHIMEKVDKALGTEPKKDAAPAAPKPDARLKMRK